MTSHMRRCSLTTPISPTIPPTCHGGEWNRWANRSTCGATNAQSLLAGACESRLGGGRLLLVLVHDQGGYLDGAQVFRGGRAGMQLAADYKEDAVGHIAVRQHLTQDARAASCRCAVLHDGDAPSASHRRHAQPRLARSTPLGAQPPALQRIQAPSPRPQPELAVASVGPNLCGRNPCCSGLAEAAGCIASTETPSRRLASGRASICPYTNASLPLGSPAQNAPWAKRRIRLAKHPLQARQCGALPKVSGAHGEQVDAQQ
jgi:hypothetical protein